MRSIVIIGNGIAGITAAREIRKRSDDKITVISSETDYFYSRTALMYLFMGHMEYHHLKPYEDWFWAKNRIDLVRGYVERIDFEGKALHLAERSVSYDVLILAVGSKPNFFGWPGQGLRGVQGLYGMPDLERMQADTNGVRQAVVVGGGLIGIELCEMLLSKGIQTTMLVREKSYWNSVLPDEESALIGDHVREHHVDLRTHTELAELHDDGTGRVGSLTTKTGETLPAQFVGIAVGVSPNIDFLKNTPLETDRGILVNEFLETNLPGVYAIGDCVQHRTPPPNRKPLEQIWYTGRMMGETLAQTITGTRSAYDPGVFFNSAKFFDIEYQTYGFAPAHLNESPDLKTFYWQNAARKVAMRFYFRADTGVVVGMNTLGIRQRQAVWSRWISEERTIGEVMGNLEKANFDPEFFRRYEDEIVDAFQGQFAEWRVERKSRSIFAKLF
ncbi:MAG: FAD-dependent oxidoreductase [Cytophagales bacterium]|nr:MAG: FAD-dependent oxidoreductase [Cytophagales bacterium]